ncbi:MAG TPA: glycosyltransferase [Bryobacteraceae bacterium]|jgi:glycosyltransferase involved in cell wall biosynthesis|nr:glycosyltransferase [Bryobacteraceae bacterium]
MKPAVSIVVEAYNEEVNALAPPDDTLQALLGQDFPLEQAELILIGSDEQIAQWEKSYATWPRFLRVRLFAANTEDSYYWQLKNKGAELAEADIVALIDCDALPGPRWLSSGMGAIREGADVSVGPTSYRTESLSPDSPWMMAAALPTWSFALAVNSSPSELRANALLAHNLFIRRRLLLEHPFRFFRHSFPSSLLFFELKRAGARFSYQPGQRVAHGMNFRWWLARSHFRRGWETYAGRNADPNWPRIKLLRKLPWIEPVVLRMGLVCRDARHWFRFSRVLGVSRPKAILLFPIAVIASFLARTAEMIGMYAALLAPKATEHQARF